jgi:hypothetical protein
MNWGESSAALLGIRQSGQVRYAMSYTWSVERVSTLRVSSRVR